MSLSETSTIIDATVASSEPATLLRARDLSRQQGSHVLVEDLNLELKRGQILGLLGLNGAGKSTTLNLLAGVLTPTTGDVTIAGHSLLHKPQLAKQALGYLPENPPLYMDMRVEDYLLYCAKLRGIKRKHRKQAVQQALADCDLSTAKRRLIRNLSKGYRQRIGIAQAIVHRPAVILLDEPSSGLDPQQMMDMRSLIQQLAEQSAIVFSTHLLSEAQDICDSVSVIHHGRQIHQQQLGSLAAAGNPHGDSTTLTMTLTLKERVRTNQLNRVAGVLRATGLPEQRWRLEVIASDADRLASAIAAEGWHLIELTRKQSELESLFTGLIKGGGSEIEIDNTSKHAAVESTPDSDLSQVSGQTQFINADQQVQAGIAGHRTSDVAGDLKQRGSSSSKHSVEPID